MLEGPFSYGWCGKRVQWAACRQGAVGLKPQPTLPCLLLAQAKAQPALSHTHPPLLFTLCCAGWACRQPWRHARSSVSAWMAASWLPLASLAC